MKISLADHYGMCFGVRDALRKTHDTALACPVTVLGELVHNPVVQEHLATLGVRKGELENPGSSATGRVIITAHGAADRNRRAWQEAGYQVTDTTCPLVRKAHNALATLVAAGCQPVIIGQRGHVEVRGLCGDFAGALVAGDEAEIDALPAAERYGVVAQTTQPIARVKFLVARLQARFPESVIDFRDTVCQPTKDRQGAMEKLCRENNLIIVIGGRNSNNTRQLTETARSMGATARQVETAADLQEEWFSPGDRVGITAGTSTLDETVQAVVARIKQMEANTHLPAPMAWVSMAARALISHR